MEATTLARVFEPFFTTKPLGEGTGLGLSVVHGIMKAHSGAATIDSTPSVGTTATLYFPVAVIPLDGPHESPSAAHASEDAPIGPRKNILYIDDDYALVFLVKRMLERRGYSVAAHTSQREALAALRSDPRAFDIVITDFNMPGMSGLDIAREVHGIRSDLPVAIASGFLDEDLRANAGDAGVRELIFKASDLTEYCAQIQRSMLVMDGVHNS
jgi:CheY-like chemotaxis protein